MTAEDYLRRVDFELRDLPWGTRREPVSEIRGHLALALIGLAIGAIIWIDSYRPIGFAGSTRLPLDAKGAAGLEGDAVVVHPGRPFEFGITVQNTGRFTVQVLGVPYSLLVLPFSARLLMSSPQKEPGMEEPWKPFHPFDMKPGEIRWLVFKGTYDCGTMSAGSGLTLVDFPVRFKFLWRTTTASIPLDEQLAFEMPPGAPCPATR